MSLFYSMLMILFVIANTIKNLQFMLNEVNAWCDKWLLYINECKSKIIQIIQKSPC